MFSETEIQQMVDRLQRQKEQNTRATKKYRESHREKVNKICKSYYDRHKTDEVWLANLRAKQRNYAKLRKAQKKLESTNSQDIILKN